MFFIFVLPHIDSSSWTMHKRIIVFELLIYPHSGQVIYTTFMKIIRFKLKNKIMSITFDNKTSNTAAIGMLQRFKFNFKRCIFFMVNVFVML